MVNDGSVQRENAFHADAETHLSDGDGFTRTAVFFGDHDALENLDALLAAFLNANVNAHIIARLERRNVVS